MLRVFAILSEVSPDSTRIFSTQPELMITEQRTTLVMLKIELRTLVES